MKKKDSCPVCAPRYSADQALWQVVRARLREVRVPDGLVDRLRVALAAERAFTHEWLQGDTP